MRINTNNTNKIAWLKNLYTGEEFEALFPMDEDKMDELEDRATCKGSHDCAVCASEGFYGFADEFCTPYDLNELAERIETLEDKDADKFEAMAEYCDNLDDIESAWNNSYFYTNTTLADYAELHAEECGFLEAVPDFIRGYIDWEDMAEDMKTGYGYSEINGGVLYVAQ